MNQMFFNQPCGKIGADRLVHVRFKMFTFEKANSLRGPLILIIPVSGLHIDLDYLEDEATP